MRTEALKDNPFRECIGTHITQYFDSNSGSTDSRAQEWDAHKVTLRGHCIATTWGTRNTLQKELVREEHTLSHLRMLLPENHQLGEQVKQVYRKCRDLETSLARIDYRHYIKRQHSEGDRSGRMLAWLLKEEHTNIPIGAIRGTDGTIHCSQLEINEIFADYYRTLYSDPQPHTQEAVLQYIQNIQLACLTPEQCEELETPLQLSEIRYAIKQISRNKTPGTDGLPIEYYATYIETLAPKLLEVFNEAWQKGTLPASLREALIVVLHKKGRDPLDVRSYRPLSLLNTDYKILGKILANRLRPLITAMVHPDQNGFIPGRSTFINNRRLIHVIQESRQMEGEPVAVSLDVEKAFDTLGWQYLHAVLGEMQFGPVFTRWLQTLYNGPLARVRVGRIISNNFSINRGTRQGCPLSPMIFALAMEPLACRLRSQALQWGILIQGRHEMVSLYADDSLVFLRQPEVNLVDLMEELDLFGVISGLRVNWPKSCVFPLKYTPTRRQNPIRDINITWKYDTFKYLGIQIYHEEADLLEGNL